LLDKRLGHTITPAGLNPKDDQVIAVKKYPTPKNVKEIQQFLGLTSYYHRFIKQFAKITHPLHALTCNSTKFVWTEECQIAFDDLKEQLVTAPALAYPNFDKNFILETDANIKGIRVVLSQQQEEGQVHPVAFASRALSQQERNYSVTDLETLAVVWAVNHFHAYLYGHDVEIRTDCSAVKAVLSTPSPNGKHACWWSKIYNSGVTAATITHRAGKENLNVDVLSRNPHNLPPDNGIGEEEVQIAVITNVSSVSDLETISNNSEVTIADMLESQDCKEGISQPNDFASSLPLKLLGEHFSSPATILCIYIVQNVIYDGKVNIF